MPNIKNKLMINGESISVYSIKTSQIETAEEILSFQNGNLINNVHITKLNWYKNEIKIGDLVLLVLGGDRRPWENGLVAFAKVYSIDYLEKSSKNYELDVEILWKLPVEMTPDDFYIYPDVKNAQNIGPSINGTPNQAIGKISIKALFSIFAAINNTFIGKEQYIKDILGEENFSNILDVPVLKDWNPKDQIEEDLSITNGFSKDSSQIFTPKSISIDKNTYSVFELNRKFNKRLINLDSDFQRLDVWRSGQKSELIESILMGLPIPIFYFNEGSNGELIVVDGRQRLTAFFEFIDNRFPLTGLSILSQHNDKLFKDLDPLLQSRIEDYQIQSYVIVPPTDDSIKFHIFDRVNRAGTQLNKQEIRNALYNGQITNFLKDIVKSAIFRQSTSDYFVKDTRMKDRYIVLRYLAFEFYFEHLKYGYEFADIDTLLGNAMSHFNQLDEETFDLYSAKVQVGLENAIFYLGKDAFINKNNKSSRPINMNIFETQMYFLSRIPQKEELKQVVFVKLDSLFQEDNFIDSIGSFRDGKTKIETRFEIMKKLLREINV
jgi:hypothetical protein